MASRPAVVVDMDGTLCDVSAVVHLQARDDGFAAFHHACAGCPPHPAVLDWCVDHYHRGHEILIVSGRDAWARALTVEWLARHLPVPVAGVFLRAQGDYRSNVQVKRDIHRRLARTFAIRAAIDDDPEIVGLWLELGIPAAMVLDGGEVLHTGLTPGTEAGPAG
jgi:hypothetical protein